MWLWTISTCTRHWRCPADGVGAESTSTAGALAGQTRSRYALAVSFRLTQLSREELRSRAVELADELDEREHRDLVITMCHFATRLALRAVETHGRRRGILLLISSRSHRLAALRR